MPVAGIFCLGRYQERWLASAIHNLKYSGGTALVETLVRFVVRAWPAAMPHNDTIITHVPLHPRRRRERGFDQAAVIAAALGQKLELPFASLVRRTKRTPTQTSLDRRGRAANVSDAFRWAVDDGAAGVVRAKRAILVDDVVTTGATIAAVAHELKAHGVHSIWAVTLAASVPEHDTFTRGLSR